MNIIFFGSSKYVIPIIKVLNENYSLVLVITTEKQDGAVPIFCKSNNLNCISVADLQDKNTKYKIQNTKASIAVLADFGLIIPSEILNLFPKGIINLHPSLLPKYRGPAPVQTAILNGEKITGVSIMKLDNEIDHGPILKQEKEKILDADTAETLYKRLFARGASLLPKVLNSYFKDELKPITQNHKEATFTNPLTRQDGFVDISKIKDHLSPEGEKSKTELERKIRAYFPWPGVWLKTKLNNAEKIIITFTLSFSSALATFWTQLF